MIVDASIVDAPGSTKNRQRARDPEMHQTRKGKQWYFGMKAHIGEDRLARARLIVSPGGHHPRPSGEPSSPNQPRPRARSGAAFNRLRGRRPCRR